MKKAQAAMEFLMTYGWAILVVLVAIGALAYFGVLNPARFLPESCTISPGLSCEEYVITSGTGVATLILRNGLGTQLHTITVAIDDDDSGLYTDPGEVSDGDGAGGNICGGVATVADGATLRCDWTNLATAGTGISGGRYKANIKISYQQAGSTLAHSKMGIIQTKLE